MVAREIGEMFKHSGFERISGAYQEAAYWCRDAENEVICFAVYDFSRGYYLSGDELREDFEGVRRYFVENKEKEAALSVVSIVCTYGSNCCFGEARSIMREAGMVNCMFVDLDEFRLIVYEDQPVAYEGLKDTIEKLLDRIREDGQAEDFNIFKRAPVTLILVIINVVIFIIMEMAGDTTNVYYMYEHGAMYMPAIIRDGEYYRLFTAMFLHFGVEHLAGNMMALIFIGDNVEKALGKVKYVLLYILTGIFASMSSVFVNVLTDCYAVAAGASGAVFGVIGALVHIKWVDKGRFGGFDRRRLIFAVVYMLFTGFTSSGVDNAAHVGGLAAGLILGIIFCNSSAITLKKG